MSDYNDFMPHGFCIHWDIPLLSLHVLSDLFIALSYFVISAGILYIVKVREDTSFRAVYYLFALFIAACGMTHMMSIVTFWIPVYWLSGFIKLITAVVSVATAIYLVPLLPKIAQLPSLSELLDINQQLKTENNRRRQAETELEKSTHQLADSNRMLQTVLDAIPVRVFWKDRQLQFLGANSLFVSDCNLKNQADLVGKSDFDMPWAQTDADHYRDDDSNVLNSGQAKLQIVEQQHTKSGDVIWLQTNKVPLKNADNEIIGVLGTYDDITQRKQTEDNLLEAKEAAEQANRAKSDFLARMSHELRTPLNGILGFTQLLKMDKDLSQQQQEYISVISSSGQHLLDLVNDVLDLARIESGKVQVILVDLNLNQIVNEIQRLIEPEIESKQLSLMVEMPENPLWVKADSIRLKEVLLNLLSNAIKYNCSQGQIIVRAFKDESYVMIEIEDTGEGIAEKSQADIFEPFNRLDKEFSEIEGSGIGLPISKQLINLMQGKIGLRSSPGKGSVFWIKLQRGLNSQSQPRDRK